MSSEQERERERCTRTDHHSLVTSGESIFNQIVSAEKCIEEESQSKKNENKGSHRNENQIAE